MGLSRTMNDTLKVLNDNRVHFAIKRKDSKNFFLTKVRPEKFNGINKYQICNLEDATPFTQAEAEKVLDEVSVNDDGTQNFDYIMVPVETEVIRRVTKVSESDSAYL